MLFDSLPELSGVQSSLHVSIIRRFQQCQQLLNEAASYKKGMIYLEQLHLQLTNVEMEYNKLLLQEEILEEREMAKLILDDDKPQWRSVVLSRVKIPDDTKEKAREAKLYIAAVRRFIFLCERMLERYGEIGQFLDSRASQEPEAPATA